MHCILTPSPWYATTTTMAHGLALMLIMLECMERCHVGFGRTESTLLLVYVWICVCHYLIDDALWNHHKCITMGIGTARGSALILTLIESVSCWLWTNSLYVEISVDVYLTNGSVLMSVACMERCYVHFGRTDGTLTLMHVWFWMCHYLIYIYGIRCKTNASKLHARLQFKCFYNTTWLGADVDVDVD